MGISRRWHQTVGFLFVEDDDELRVEDAKKVRDRQIVEFPTYLTGLENLLS